MMKKGVGESMFFLVGGKSYVIFALLFGLTFVHQKSNQENKGSDCGGRFAWRLILLTVFATINAAFFPGGDVLLLFTITGFMMIPFRKASQKTFLVAAIFFLLQPLELLASVGIKIIPSFPVGEYYNIVNEATSTGNFWVRIWANATIGQIGSVYWAFETCRCCLKY